MCLFAIIVTLLIVAAAIAIAVIGTFGGAVLVVFGDVIVFVGIVWLIVKLIKKFKKK